MSVLKGIAARKRGEVAGLRAWGAALRRQAEAAEAARPLSSALKGETVKLLAEVKRRSPSAGWIREGADAAGMARVYEAAGASGVSVLTDEADFGGRLEDLRSVRSAVGVPVLRKDFVVDPVQVWEARSAGADAYLLIVAMLESGELEELFAVGRELGMEALVEVHDGRELERALKLEPPLVGINNRDLATFATDLGVTEALAAQVPAAVTLVGESGIHGPEEVERLGAAGVDAVLVGESLMRAADALSAAEALVGHARTPRPGWDGGGVAEPDSESDSRGG